MLFAKINGVFMQLGMTKITNMNDYPYRELFKGQKIEILPHKSIEMESGEAHIFKGTMGSGPKFNDGIQDPETYKWLKFETAAEVKRASVNKFRCEACGKVCKTQKSLGEHMKVHVDLPEATLADGTIPGDEDDKSKG